MLVAAKNRTMATMCGIELFMIDFICTMVYEIALKIFKNTSFWGNSSFKKCKNYTDRHFVKKGCCFTPFLLFLFF